MASRIHVYTCTKPELWALFDDVITQTLPLGYMFTPALNQNYGRCLMTLQHKHMASRIHVYTCTKPELWALFDDVTTQTWPLGYMFTPALNQKYGRCLMMLQHKHGL